MNILRHDFVKQSRLSAQILSNIQKYTADFLRIEHIDSIALEICSAQEKDWQSATYEGKTHIYALRVSWPSCNHSKIYLDQYLAEICAKLADHEFDMFGSFVADIKARNCHIENGTMQLNIEALIIHEE